MAEKSLSPEQEAALQKAMERAASKPDRVSNEEAGKWGWQSTSRSEQGKADEKANPSSGSGGAGSGSGS